MAHVIEQLNIPTLIMSHNKTLARQLHKKWWLLPRQRRGILRLHYDYYQPEAYLAKRDLYIDKELSINERIEQERFAAVLHWCPVPIGRGVVGVVHLRPQPSRDVPRIPSALPRWSGDRDHDLLRELIELQYRRTTTDSSVASAECEGSGRHMDASATTRFALCSI